MACRLRPLSALQVVHSVFKQCWHCNVCDYELSKVLPWADFYSHMQCLPVRHEVSASFVETNIWLDPTWWSSKRSKTLSSSSAGLRVIVGRNNTDNRDLSFHLAFEKVTISSSIAYVNVATDALSLQSQVCKAGISSGTALSIISRSCRYRSNFTSLGWFCSPRYVSPEHSCVTEAA